MHFISFLNKYVTGLTGGRMDEIISLISHEKMQDEESQFALYHDG